MSMNSLHIPYRHPKSVLLGGDARGKSCVKKAKASSLGYHIRQCAHIILYSKMAARIPLTFLVYEYKFN